MLRLQTVNQVSSIPNKLPLPVRLALPDGMEDPCAPDGMSHTISFEAGVFSKGIPQIT